jgi:putative hemolysin
MPIVLIIAILSLIGSATLAGTATALFQLGRLRAKEEFKKINSLFFFQHLLKPLFGQNRWEGLFLTLSLSKHLLHLAYALSAFFFFFLQSSGLIFICLAIILLSLAADTLMKFIATLTPKVALKFFSPTASLFLLLFSPLAALALRLFHPLLPKNSAKTTPLPTIRDKILEVLYESELSSHLDPQERKLILSVANFKQRSVREVMVPRIDVVSLDEETPLAEAAQIFLKERYSRLPIYQNSIDHIIGVLLYKDILSAYTSKTPPTSIRPLIKPVLYTPETKKIAHLLQEFRSKQIHLAIVVDEYGGTEGIITVEDILEELVGEIADEDDLQQELLYTRLPAGGWIVDARMTILDIEKELGMKIPLSPEYDTLGGYIYHRAGAIPAAGWRLHHDDFDLEILSSDERSIDKVRILPHVTEDS